MLMLVQGFYLGQAFEFGITDSTFMTFKITDAYAVSNNVVYIVGTISKGQVVPEGCDSSSNMIGVYYIFKIRLSTRGMVLEEKYIGPFLGNWEGAKVKKLPNGDWLLIGGDTVSEISVNHCV